MNLNFIKFFLLLPGYFYCSLCVEKYTGRFMDLFISTLISSIIFVLKFMLLACIPNFV